MTLYVLILYQQLCQILTFGYLQIISYAVSPLEAGRILTKCHGRYTGTTGNTFFPENPEIPRVCLGSRYAPEIMYRILT